MRSRSATLMGAGATVLVFKLSE
eukprot:COSAG06_NODE_57880_length_279_cov_0.550000_1_plen_22_part_01